MSRRSSKVAVTIAAALLAGCNAEASKPKATPVTVQPVQVLSVSLEPGSTGWSYTGTVRPRYESDLAFRVAGKIVSRHVDVGQIVKPGEVIARLDETDLRLAVEAQEAELRAAVTSRDQATAAEGRYRTLLKDRYVSEAAFDQRRAAADEARARVERAQRNLDIAKNQLAYAKLVATAAGVVSSLSAEAGQVVTVGQPIAKQAQLDELEIAVAVPEHMAGAVAKATAEASVWNATDTKLPVKLREMSPEADRVTRTYTARFSLPPGSRLELGRSATVQLAAGGAAQVARLPLSAVMSDGRAAHVYVLDGDTRVKRRPVTIASLGESYALVSSGIEPGERIVAMGVHRLDDGQPVRVVGERARSD